MLERERAAKFANQFFNLVRCGVANSLSNLDGWIGIHTQMKWHTSDKVRRPSLPIGRPSQTTQFVVHGQRSTGDRLTSTDGVGQLGMRVPCRITSITIYRPSTLSRASSAGPGSTTWRVGRVRKYTGQDRWPFAENR